MRGAQGRAGGQDARPRVWTRSFMIVTLIHFVNASNFYLLTVIASSYAVEVYGADLAAAGLAAGVFVVGALLSRSVGGRMLALLSYKKTLVIGLCIATASSAAYLLSPSLPAFITVRTAHGFGFGLNVSALTTIVADITPRRRLGEGMGYFQLAATVATAAGPFVAILLSGAGSYQAVFLICVALLLLSLALMPFLRLRRIDLDAEQRSQFRGFSLSAFIELPVLPASAVAMLMYLSYGAIVAFLALFTASVGIAGHASLFFIVYAAVIFATRPFVSKLFDSRPAGVILYPALCVLTLGFVILSRMDGTASLLAAGLVVGLGQGAVQAVTLALVARMTPPHRQGMATSTYYLMCDIGYSAGPMISGVMLMFVGYFGLYLAMAAVIVIALAFCLAMRRRMGL
jgi:MFS family permease